VKGTIVEFPEHRTIEAEAARWLVRLDGDTPVSDATLRELREWLARSAVHRTTLEGLARNWRQLNVLTELSVPLGRLESKRRSTFAGKAHGLLHWGTPACTALLFAAVLLFGGGFYWMTSLSLLASNGLYTTAVGEQKTALLADGSAILLNTNTRVEVNFSKGYRDVRLLQGEAEFTVAKNPDAPFRVYVGKERVQAIGTAFTVYLKDSEVEVTVTEGQVALATLERAAQAQAQAQAPLAVEDVSSSPVTQAAAVAAANSYVEVLGTLRAGQRATMKNAPALDDTDTSILSAVEKVETVEGDIAKSLSWRNGYLIFSGDSLEDVVREISRYTTIEVEFADARAKEIRVGGQFKVGETDAMLEVLQASFGLKVTRLGREHVLLSVAEQ